MGTRVAFFDAYPQAYTGAQRATHLSAGALRCHGWEVVVVLPGVGLFADRLQRDGVPTRVVAVPPALDHYGRTTTGWRRAHAAAALPPYWNKLKRVLREADLVHVNDHRGLVLAGPAARLAGVPLVWHTHGVLPPKTLNLVGRVLARRTIVVTAADAKRLPGRRVRPAPDVVPNAAEDHFFDVVRQPADPPKLVTIARLNSVKGVDVLLRALAKVRSHGSDVVATVLGGRQEGYATYADELEVLRQNLGLEKVVTFEDHADRPEDVLATASIYIQPSRWEGVPMAVLEAMAVGLPVVATSVGGQVDIIEHEITGLLVPPEDPGALAEAVIRLLDEPDLAERLGAAGREMALRHHSVEASVARLVEVYRAALV